ncbi:epidermal differentiation-specific protein-like [Pygocentrus nattereri]|uniref:Beta/gamma crystallin 'Greek key' domain-containing protein n=1 Tax=Pygocentrus nattereri TaxID=42514 RepID=A0AAR2KEE5_PYGNA|nr:epidermal differentiation-specific protein-like [Pygocentrus nattereri]
MNKIIVYEQINFGGIGKEFTSSVPNLVMENFNDCISSLKVIGNPWVVYTDRNFSGSQFVYEEGEYPTVEFNDRISSLEVVTEDLTYPQITLYEHDKFRGRSLILTTETNLVYGSFHDVASSHKVQRGAWVLYEHINRQGAQMVARASHDLPNYGWFNDRVSHVRPLKPGKSIIKAEILWDKKEEHVKSITIDSICGLNKGEHEQSFSTELFKEYTASVTDNFSFSNSTQISWGTSFSVDVGMVKGEQNFSFSNTFTVERGGSNTRTERKSTQITLPTKIAPQTKLTVNVLRKEVDVKVPVKLTIQTGYNTHVEFGEYRCQSGNSITAEFKEEKI